MSLGDKLIADHQERKDRDDLLASAMTLGDFRAILENIGTSRDDVPVVLDGEPLRVITDWRGEWWGPKPVLALYYEDQEHVTQRAETAHYATLKEGSDEKTSQ